VDERDRALWFLVDAEGRRCSTRGGGKDDDDDRTEALRRISSTPPVLTRRALQEWLGAAHLQFLTIQTVRQLEHWWLCCRRKAGVAGGSDPNPNDSSLVLSELFELRLCLLRDDHAVATSQVASLFHVKPGQKEAAIHFVQQLIVLVGHLSDLSDLAEHTFQPLYQEWETSLRQVVRIDAYDSQYDHANDQEDRNNCSPFVRNVLDALAPQPRRDTIAGLVAEPSSDNDDLTVASATGLLAGRLYRLVLDRTSVSRSEWFSLWHREDCDHRRLSSTSQEEDGCPTSCRQRSYNRFHCGIYQLLYLGLIRQRAIAKQKDVQYDKTVLVWCGGE